MQRLFIDHHQITQNILQLDRATAHHLLRVCRLSVNDTIELVVNQDRLLQVRIVSITDHQLEISVMDQWALNAQRSFQISLIQSIPKQDKLTDVCRMCTELGASSFHPVISEYCDVRNVSDNKFRRAQMAMESSAKQSKQTLIPKLYSPQPLEDFCSTIPTDSQTLRLVAHEGAIGGLRDAIGNTSFQHVIIAIGPEGGFGPKDLHIFDQFLFKPFSLGNSF